MQKDIIEQISEFKKTCDSMNSSKYVLIDKSISAVLKSIAKNKEIFNVIAEEVINFNFPFYYKRATQEKGKFLIPDEGDLKIAFCFCLLNEIDNKTINVTYLIANHFNKDAVIGYKLFCEKIINRFSTEVLNKFAMFETDVVANKTDSVSKKNYDSALIERIVFLLNDIQIKINAEKRINFETKFEVSTICSSVVECLLGGNTSPVFGLFFGLKSICRKIKTLKNEILELKSLFFD